MSSNIRIPKRCQSCKKEFIAKKLTTKYCSHKCNSKDYKAKIKENKIKNGYETFKDSLNIKQHNSESSPKPYLTIKETCILLNACDTTVRKAIKNGTISTLRLGKKYIISREEIEKKFYS